MQWLVVNPQPEPDVGFMNTEDHTNLLREVFAHVSELYHPALTEDPPGLREIRFNFVEVLGAPSKQYKPDPQNEPTLYAKWYLANCIYSRDVTKIKAWRPNGPCEVTGWA